MLMGTVSAAELSCVRCVAPPLAFGDGWSGRSDLARRPPAAACCPAAPCGATLLFLLDLTTWKSAFGSFLPEGCCSAGHHLAPFSVVR